MTTTTRPTLTAADPAVKILLDAIRIDTDRFVDTCKGAPTIGYAQDTLLRIDGMISAVALLIGRDHADVFLAHLRLDREYQTVLRLHNAKASA